MSRAVLAALLGATLLLTSARAEAYCQKTTCEPEKQACKKDRYGCIASGSGLTWHSDTIPYRFHAAGSSRFDDETVRTALRSAIGRWESARCAGGRTSLTFSEEKDLRTRVTEGRSAPMNFGIYFRDVGWPGSSTELAVTNFDRGDNSGKIFGANIELNTTDHVFGVGLADEPDLEAVMVHEIGHYLGLDHSGEPGSVMTAVYCDGQSPCTRTVEELRELQDDDIAGVCALYPARRTALDAAVPNSGCQHAPGPRGADRFGLATLIAVIACLVGARRSATWIDALGSAGSSGARGRSPLPPASRSHHAPPARSRRTAVRTLR